MGVVADLGSGGGGVGWLRGRRRGRWWMLPRQGGGVRFYQVEKGENGLTNGLGGHYGDGALDACEGEDAWAVVGLGERGWSLGDCGCRSRGGG